jgi:dTDP-4-dehydrorhamnose 3,5-epimerase
VKFTPFSPFSDAFLVQVSPHRDARGMLGETLRLDALEREGIVEVFRQEHEAHSLKKGTVRGLHFQIGDAAQAKLVRCLKGSAFVVIVDLRRRSPTFGRHGTTTLKAGDWRQVFMPRGFAHGYCTLRAGTAVLYKVSAFYDPAAERGLSWNDPALGIAWPVATEDAILSPRDASLPLLSELPVLF